MLEIIAKISLLILVIIMSIVFHEAGHILLLKKYGGKYKIKTRYGKSKMIPNKISIIYDDMFLNKNQGRGVLVVGIIGGLIPIILFLNGFLLIIGMIYYVVVGCKHDIKELVEDVKL